MPIGGLLVGVGDFEDGLLREGLADNLHPYRQPVGKASRDGDSRQSGNIYGQGADVAQIHLERVVYLLTDFEGDGG